jgi:hypothetical protein
MNIKMTLRGKFLTNNMTLNLKRGKKINILNKKINYFNI